MENHISLSAPKSGCKEPIIENIKYDYSFDDGSTESELSYINVPECIIEEEESSVDETFKCTSTALDVPNKELSGIFKCTRCEFQSTSLKNLISHYEEHRKKEPFKCFQCGFNGKDREEFVDHSHSHIRETYFKCSKCSFKTYTEAAIKDHLQQHTKDAPNEHKCPLCNRVFSSKWSRKLHITRCKKIPNQTVYPDSSNDVDGIPDTTIKVQDSKTSSSSVHICPYCYYIFNSRRRKARHIYNVHVRKKKSEDDSTKSKILLKSDRICELDAPNVIPPDMSPSVRLERIYLCPICHYVFTSVSTLNQHIITHEAVTECPVCKFECETNAELKGHLTSHSSEESKHPCTICGMKFSTLGKLKYHIRDEHSKKYKCPFCDRSIKTENALRLHLEAHSKMKEYYCPNCKFSTRNSLLLQYHMSKYHPQNKKFSCNLCDKSYKYKYSLQRHSENCPGKDFPVSLKEPEKNEAEIEIDISQKEQLICSECKATFKKPIHLKKHLLVHFHMKPFRCLKCGYRCKTKQTLSGHMKVHNMKASYECRLCHKRFKQKHALNNHSIIHSEERPFVCEVCGLSFKRKANYRRHYDIHSNIKPYRCHSCGFTSRRKDGLQKHLQTHEKP